MELSLDLQRILWCFTPLLYRWLLLLLLLLLLFLLLLLLLLLKLFISSEIFSLQNHFIKIDTMFLTCEKYRETNQRLVRLFLHVKKNGPVFLATTVNGQPHASRHYRILIPPRMSARRVPQCGWHWMCTTVSLAF